MSQEKIQWHKQKNCCIILKWQVANDHIIALGNGYKRTYIKIAIISRWFELDSICLNPMFLNFFVF